LEISIAVIPFTSCAVVGDKERFEVKDLAAINLRCGGIRSERVDIQRHHRNDS
jgi:hypothetical protein